MDVSGPGLDWMTSKVFFHLKMSWLYNINDFLFIDVMIFWVWWRVWAKITCWLHLPAQVLTWDTVDTSDIIVECAFVFIDLIMICVSTDILFIESGWQMLRKVLNFLPYHWKVRIFLCCAYVPTFSWLSLIHNNNNRRENDDSLNSRAENGKLLR